MARGKCRGYIENEEMSDFKKSENKWRKGSLQYVYCLKCGLSNMRFLQCPRHSMSLHHPLYEYSMLRVNVKWKKDLKYWYEILWDIAHGWVMTHTLMIHGLSISHIHVKYYIWTRHDSYMNNTWMKYFTYSCEMLCRNESRRTHE